MITLEKKNCNTTLNRKYQKFQKYQDHHQVRMINMNILQVNEYYLPIKLE